MAMSLVQTSEVVKKAVVIGAGLITLYIVLLLLKAPVVGIFRFIFPDKNKPEIAFGLIDSLEFTEAPILNANPLYVLNTQTGGLPGDLPKVLPVFKFIQPSFSFGAGQKAQEDAAFLGFGDDSRITDLDERVYSWQDVALGKSLIIDTATSGLEVNTVFTGKGSLFPAGILTKDLAIQLARQMLIQIERFEDKLYVLEERGSQEVELGKFRGNNLVKADSVSEAQFAKVDFYRQILDYPILGSDPTQSLLQVYVKAQTRNDEFPELNYPRVTAYHWEVDTDQQSTYPLIPVDLAWQEISAGRGVIANATPNGLSPFDKPPSVRAERILVNEIYLAYYDRNVPQSFLQPIYVFEGNYTSTGSGGTSGIITIYYPAVSGEYVKQN